MAKKFFASRIEVKVQTPSLSAFQPTDFAFRRVWRLRKPGFIRLATVVGRTPTAITGGTPC
jgi:hypothetical protein